MCASAGRAIIDWFAMRSFQCIGESSARQGAKCIYGYVMSCITPISCALNAAAVITEYASSTAPWLTWKRRKAIACSHFAVRIDINLPKIERTASGACSCHLHFIHRPYQPNVLKCPTSPSPFPIYITPRVMLRCGNTKSASFK